MDGHCLDGAFFIWEFVPCCFGPWEVTSAVRFEPEPDDEDTIQFCHRPWGFLWGWEIKLVLTWKPPA